MKLFKYCKCKSYFLNCDEFNNVNSNRGRDPIRPAWCLCIVNTSTRRSTGFATMIPNIAVKTMIPIIEQIVRPGSIIYNEAKAYQHLKASSKRYEHKSVCHKYNFVDPVAGAHTQNVESFNNKLKVPSKTCE